MVLTVAGLLVEGVVDAAQLRRLPGSPCVSGRVAPGAEVFSKGAGFDADWAIATLDGWTVLTNSTLRGMDSEQVSRDLSRGRRVFAFVAYGANATHGFAWFVDGELLRAIFYADFELIGAEGGPLPEEAMLAEPGDGRYVFGMMTLLTGVRLGDLVDAPYQVLVTTHPN
ncbi:DUF6461 domain-containing protein [Nocardia arthritidis]|uniref:Uncharacterized protein n=1 Tax=Nocardia arthritidis TaxID=228602 RepID=A0A6G9YG27_9NOCA|nr:DUF6461 domain-containing protein [Nocardia arthritidis]QIS11923.1 hypothetical protein F5544_20290 [Nocardia arthritidis]